MARGQQFFGPPIRLLTIPQIRSRRLLLSTNGEIRKDESEQRVGLSLE